MSAMTWLTAPLLLSGCGSALMDPTGEVGQGLKSLIITAFGLMLIVVIPVIVMTILFAWKYRSTNLAAKYTPNWEHSNIIEVFVWAIPAVIILFLAILTWQTSHEYDPHKPIASADETMTIDAISLDWKWLFVYPEQGIATINELALPVDTPVHFRVTSGTVMNSFMIPTLGSQIYAMAGMANDVYLEGSETGTFRGRSTHYSGAGFSEMLFDTHVTSEQDFQTWVDKVKQSPDTMMFPQDYDQVAKPSIAAPIQYFSQVSPNFYEDLIQSYKAGHGGPSHGEHNEAQEPSMPMSAQAAE
ncbi:ubiquinol oxidase subunit 2 [Salinicola rhizosphaerae]|uniref:Ubiquinol oxidase subunit 2 n=1 Tax=Salinicola rhizosphaerae TaxID=1443141 RepID=A0ABQ3DPN8_9GAMM|nr:ubiquinol oxidase subunit 2 [Salinicola rhizosphaerae]